MKIDDFKIKDCKEILDNRIYRKEKLKLIWMWVKENYISLNEFDVLDAYINEYVEEICGMCQ